MYPVSSLFLPALSVSAQVVTGCRLLRADGSFTDLKIQTANVTLDRTQQASRGQFSAVIVDEGGVLCKAGALSLGAKLYPYRGVQYAPGATEVVPLGVYRMSQPQMKEDRGGILVTAQGYDLSRQCSFRPFLDSFQVAAGLDVSQEIQVIMHQQASDVTGGFFNGTLGGLTASQTVTPGSDSWMLAQSLAKGVGGELYFDRTGVLTAAPPQLVGQQPAWTGLVEGPSCTMTTLQRNQNDDGTASHVVVIGQQAAYGWVKGEADDTNPLSPTYYQGPFGVVTVTVTDTAIANSSAATARALLELTNRVGGNEQVQITCVPNPALDPGDIVQVQRAALGVQNLYYVDSVQIPLDLSDMTIVARQVG